jgi:hypothetical protein
MKNNTIAKMVRRIEITSGIRTYSGETTQITRVANQLTLARTIITHGS